MPPRFPPATLILLASLLVPAAPALAGTKLDLAPYLGRVRMPGDFKVFTWSTGGQRTVTTLDAQPWSKGWAFLTEHEITGTGDADGVSTSESYLIPGKQLLGGSQHFEDFDFVVSKPSKGLKLSGALGKLQRTKSKAALVVDGMTVGDVLRLAVWMPDGFETVTTPSGTYPSALRARSFSGVGIFDGFGEYVYLYEDWLWYAPDVGLVKVETTVEYYENGAFVESVSWTESLASGSLGGVPFP
jgi:hypothetical protein